MVVSRRERYIVMATVVAVAVLGLDHFALGPLLDARSQAQGTRQALLSEMSRGRAILRQGQELGPRWRQMAGDGIKGEPAEAESQILHAIRDWAEEAGVTLSLLRPDRLTDKTQLPQIAFQATGTGSMESIARLLWRMQNATIPVRITELQLAARREATDDLSVQLRLSTVYLPGGRPLAAQPGPTSSPAGVDK